MAAAMFSSWGVERKCQILCVGECCRVLKATAEEKGTDFGVWHAGNILPRPDGLGVADEAIEGNVLEYEREKERERG